MNITGKSESNERYNWSFFASSVKWSVWRIYLKQQRNIKKKKKYILKIFAKTEKYEIGNPKKRNKTNVQWYETVNEQTETVNIVMYTSYTNVVLEKKGFSKIF